MPLGEGSAHAWISVGEDGQPDALGVSISEQALQTVDDRDPADLTLALPPEADGTAFRHVFLNWQPHGHPPAEIWGVPHFDIHFYLIPAEEREAISPEDPEFGAKAELFPAERFMAAGFVTDAHAVPGMGVHWALPADIEAPATRSLIYGTWDGRLIFIEPMVTKEVFESRETMSAEVTGTAEVEVPGMYPTQYRIDFDENAGEHHVVLEGLVARE